MSKGRSRPRILFVSNEPAYTGAPICLLSIIRFFSETYNWEMKLIGSHDGPLLSSFEKTIPSDAFYRDDFLVLPEFGAPDDINAFYFGKLRETLKREKPFSLKSAKSAINIFKAWGYTGITRRKQHLYHKRLIRHIRQWSPDLVFCNTIVNENIVDQLNLDSLHLLYVHELENAFTALSTDHLNAIETRYDHYFTVSNATWQNLVSNHGVSQNRITISPCGLCTDTILAQAKAIPPAILKKRLGIPDDAIVIGSAGVATIAKGVDHFIGLARGILSSPTEKRPVHFVWIGENSQAGEFIATVSEQGLADRIHFPGFMENPYPFLKMFDIFIMPSRQDSFPLVNLEAALLGSPVLAFSDSGGSKEFIQNDAGYHVPDFDIDAMTRHVKRLIDDENLRLKMGEAGRAKVLENYTIKRTASRIGSVIAEKYFSNHS